MFLLKPESIHNSIGLNISSKFAMLILDQRSKWSFIDSSPFPWAKLFVEKIITEDLPHLTGPSLYISSDYSGTSRDSKFWVIGFVVADTENSGYWESRRRIVRQNYLADGRRMAFKSLNDRNRRNALIPFLSAADEISGLCLAIVIDKRIRPLHTGKEFFNEADYPKLFKGKWNLQNLEAMFRVTHFCSLLIAGLSQPSQNIYWISDNDDFFATPNRTRDTQRMLSVFTSLYVRHKPGKLGMGTTNIDESDRADEDMAAIPDLVAGSLAETMTSMSKHYGRVPALPTVLENKVSTKSALITKWFFQSKHRLKKIACLF